MAKKLKGLGLFGDHTQRETMWGGQLDTDIAAMSHMSFPSLKELRPRTTPSLPVPDGDMYLVGNGSGWGAFPDTNPPVSTRGHIAMRDLGGWHYYMVREGMIIYVQNQSSDSNGTYPPGLYVRSGGQWNYMTTTAHTPQNFAYSALTGVPAFIGCRGYLTSQLSLSVNSSRKIPLSSSGINLNQGNLLDFTNDNIKIRETGFYDIRFTGKFSAGHAVSSGTVAIRVGSTSVAEGTIFKETTLQFAGSATCHYLGKLSVNSLVSFYATASNQTNNLVAGSNDTYFDCKKVG